MSNNNTLLLLDSVAIPTRTRDEICAVQMAFQGLTVFGLPWFGVFINSLDADKRAQARAAERATGTHCIRQLSYNYANDGGYTYPIAGADFTQRLGDFRARLLEDFAADLIPVVELAGDGQSYDPNGGTYGFSWLMKNLERIITGIGGDMLDQCVVFHCWESVNYGGWSPDNLFTATAFHRQLRPNAKLAWHFSYAWPGDNFGSTLGPIGQWTTHGLDCDVMLAEGDAPFLQPTIDGGWAPLPGDALNGWQQRARCFLGPQCNNALIDPANMEPWYWPDSPQTPRGQRYAIPFELDMYRWVRNGVTLSELNAERDYCRALGFRNVC